MTDSKTTPTKNDTPCVGCGGSGQTSYFGGASRFMFTWEDCPDCHGTGITQEENQAGTEMQSTKIQSNKKADKR